MIADKLDQTFRFQITENTKFNDGWPEQCRTGPKRRC